MKYEEFRRELAAGTLHPVYLFYGGEEYLIAEGSAAVIDAVLPGPERSFSLAELGPESPAAEFKPALLSPSFLGGKRAVRVREAGGLEAAALEALAAGLARLPSGVHVVVEGSPDKRLKATKTVTGLAAAVECAPLNRYAAAAWAQARAGRLGLELDMAAARFLVETIGMGLRRIETELQKARAYLGTERNNLTCQDLGNLLGLDKEDDVFRLVDAAAGGESGRALSILADLLALGEPEARLMPLLARQVRLVLLTRHYLDCGRKPSELPSLLGVQPFLVDRLVRQAERFTIARCREIMSRMALADYRGKTGEREPRLEMELVLLHMAGGIGAGSRRAGAGRGPARSQKTPHAEAIP